jgi:hypothetical protein
MLGDGWIEELAAMLAKDAERLLFVGAHQPAVTDHVRGQDRCQPTLNTLHGHVVARNRDTKLSIYWFTGNDNGTAPAGEVREALSGLGQSASYRRGNGQATISGIGPT